MGSSGSADERFEPMESMAARQVSRHEIDDGVIAITPAND
jgi:hypothetical protein